MSFRQVLGRDLRSDLFLDCFLSSLGGGGLHGKNYPDPIDRLTVPRRIFFFQGEKIGRFRFVLITTCFSSRFRLVLDQQDTERPVLGSPAEGMCMIARHWPQFVDIVGRRPLSGMRCGLITLGATRKKKGNAQKSQHRNTLWFTCAGRVQSKLDNMLRFWDASRGYE